MSGPIARLRGSQFLRFAIVGGLGFFVNEAALFFALQILHMDRYSGAVFSFFVAVPLAWWGDGTLTWRAEAASGAIGVVLEWVKFVAANGFGFVVNYAVYAGLITFAPPPADNPYFALACGTIAGLIFNFVLSKRLVFRKA